MINYYLIKGLPIRLKNIDFFFSTCDIILKVGLFWVRAKVLTEKVLKEYNIEHQGIIK